MGRGEARRRRPLPSAKVEVAPAGLLVMVYDCMADNHYNGYVGDRTWSFDPTERPSFYCAACADAVRVSYCENGQRITSFTLDRATPDQVEDLARAAEDYARRPRR
jgi:hypothetical protein